MNPDAYQMKDETKKEQSLKTYLVTETATYEVKAESAEQAEKLFLASIQCDFPTDVLNRDVEEWEQTEEEAA